jgi:hypothetical protein
MAKLSAFRLKSDWDRIGQSLSPFIDTPSTRSYFECERLLLNRYFPALKHKRLLKTGLWDEAKNSQILFWAAEQGTDVWRAHSSSCPEAD